MSASPEIGGKCRALRGDRGKCAYTGQNRFFVFTHPYFSVFYGLSAFITPVPSKAGTNASLADSPCWT